MKNVLVVTGSRGEYGYIRPFLLKIKHFSEQITADVVVTNMHLMQSHGYSADLFADDGINIRFKVINTLESDSGAGLLKSLHLFGLSLIDILTNNDYDLILLAGDRGEQLFSSIIGFHMNIPVYHIQAGERSGHIDGMSRHAIARFSHIHLAANTDAADRLLKFGEEAFRIHNIGAPQMDEIKDISLDTSFRLPNYITTQLDNEKYCLLVFHPVFEDFESSKIELTNLLSVLDQLPLKVVVIYPNSDPGSSFISDIYDSISASKYLLFKNLDRHTYLKLLQNCEAIIGNSSSGIIEAPFFGIPAVNVGRRQHGRLRGPNVIDCSKDYTSIAAGIAQALDESFVSSLRNSPSSPYGCGDSTDKLIDLILNHETSNKLLTKEITC